MKASRRIEPALEMALQHAEDAARKVSECQRDFRDRKLQLDELVGYREDYAKGLRHKSRSGFNSSRMNDYSLFMERLNNAIVQLQASLEGASRELSASQQLLQEKLQRAKALENVVSRYQQTERQAQSRREQNESDEHAQRHARTVFS